MVDLIRLGVAFYLLIAGIFGVEDYNFLRLIVFMGILFLMFILWVGERVNNGIKAFYFIFFLVISILFNPILPVYLYDRTLWAFIDIITGILLIIKPIIINNLMDKNSEEYINHFGPIRK